MLTRFWQWYERHRTLNLGVAAGLFTLQLVHLWWLAMHVIALRLLGRSLFEAGAFEWLLILVDYTEIPAIVATSLVYANDLRERFSLKAAALLLFINTQWLHLLWITDEFVLDALSASAVSLPVWLAWAAILIDYLELPVIFDTLRRFVGALREGRGAAAFEELREEE